MKTGTLSPRTRTRALVLGGCLLLLLLLLIGRAIGGADTRNTVRADTTEARVRFLAECGWEADPDSEQMQPVLIPETFPPVFEDYNELQRSQGWDLHEYAGKECELYTYSIRNFPDESQTVLANLYLLHGRIIGGDVHSTNLNGFMAAVK